MPSVRHSLLASLLSPLLLATHGSAAQTRIKAPMAPGLTSSSPGLLLEEASGAGSTLHVAIGHSLMLRSIIPFRRIYVGDPAVIRSFTSAPAEVVITAKTIGLSSLVTWDTTGRHALYTVSVDPDPEALQASLDAAFPADHLRAEVTQGRLDVSGTVTTDAEADAVQKLAVMYGKDVLTSLRVVPVHKQQVQLKLRIIEIDRTRLEQFGINLFTGGSNASSVSTQQFSGGTTASVVGPGLISGDPLNLFYYSAAQNLGVTIKDLEQKQILQVLAEPTLTTLSGHAARFLSGGEFPFPSVQGGTGQNSTAISISFRPYGVKVEFTPTVNPDGSIRLVVSPEVSTLDFSNAVTISGFTIPALSTRRAETELELRNGQSFAVSGLLDHRTTESLSKVPGIADVPILGQLFRSKNVNHSVVELMVFVTATIIDPLSMHTSPPEPAMAVPNMEGSSFDRQLGRPKKAAGAPAP